jgi:hypothetical protein
VVRDGVFGRLHAEQEAYSEFFLAVGAQKTVIANAPKLVGQHVQQETPDEFLRAQGHCLDLVTPAIIFPPAADLTVFDVEQSVIGDGDAMDITANVVEYLLGSGERSFGKVATIALFQGVRCRVNADRSCNGSSVPKNRSLQASNVFSSDSRNSRRNREDRTRTVKRSQAISKTNDRRRGWSAAGHHIGQMRMKQELPTVP